jgi:hypothetical protein
MFSSFSPQNALPSATAPTLASYLWEPIDAPEIDTTEAGSQPNRPVSPRVAKK